jgi:hypothetical protein
MSMTRLNALAAGVKIAAPTVPAVHEKLDVVMLTTRL